jgi:hypothetical protein
MGMAATVVATVAAIVAAIAPETNVPEPVKPCQDVTATIPEIAVIAQKSMDVDATMKEADDDTGATKKKDAAEPDDESNDSQSSTRSAVSSVASPGSAAVPRTADVVPAVQDAGVLDPSQPQTPAALPLTAVVPETPQPQLQVPKKAPVAVSVLGATVVDVIVAPAVATAVAVVPSPAASFSTHAPSIQTETVVTSAQLNVPAVAAVAAVAAVSTASPPAPAQVPPPQQQPVPEHDKEQQLDETFKDCDDPFLPLLAAAARPPQQRSSSDDFQDFLRMGPETKQQQQQQQHQPQQQQPDRERLERERLEKEKELQQYQTQQEQLRGYNQNTGIVRQPGQAQRFSGFRRGPAKLIKTPH